MTTTVTRDRIEKQVTLRAPRARVWRALSDAKEFSSWFGVKLGGTFAPGQTLRGPITIKGYEHVTMEVTVERVEPEHYLAWRWHPAAIDAKKDYAQEPTTLVEFRLADVPGGTALSIVESGFDRIPAGRRDEAFRMNDGGWDGQIKNIERYVAQ